MVCTIFEISVVLFWLILLCFVFLKFCLRKNNNNNNNNKSKAKGKEVITEKLSLIRLSDLSSRKSHVAVGSVVCVSLIVIGMSSSRHSVTCEMLSGENVAASSSPP